MKLGFGWGKHRYSSSTSVPSESFLLMINKKCQSRVNCYIGKLVHLIEWNTYNIRLADSTRFHFSYHKNYLKGFC